jgi:hypothetical protein
MMRHEANTGETQDHYCPCGGFRNGGRNLGTGKRLIEGRLAKTRPLAAVGLELHGYRLGGRHHMRMGLWFWILEPPLSGFLFAPPASAMSGFGTFQTCQPEAFLVSGAIIQECRSASSRGISYN